MQPLYLRWHGKRKLKRILQVLQERGYRNVSDLTTEYATGRSHLYFNKTEFFIQYHIGNSLFLNPQTIWGGVVIQKSRANRRGNIANYLIKPPAKTH